MAEKIECDNDLQGTHEGYFGDKKYRRWVFTWFNYTDENVEELKQISSTKCSYLVFGHEICPTTGKKHLQGYVDFDCPLARTTVKSRLDPQLAKKSPVSVRPAMKPRLANERYCCKGLTADPAYDPKFFIICHTEKSPGKRTDWMDIRDLINDGKSYYDILQSYPAQAMKCPAGIKAAINATKDYVNDKTGKDQYLQAKMMLWQRRVANMIRFGDQGDRKITWFVDPKGNSGKSWLVDYLGFVHDAATFENGRTQDIAHAYNGEHVVCFDFVRSSIEHINYGVIESLKNGRVFSGKYESKCKRYAIKPTIVCFSNFHPNLAAMSADRWDIRFISDEDKEMEGSTPDISASLALTENQEDNIGEPNYHTSTINGPNELDDVSDLTKISDKTDCEPVKSSPIIIVDESKISRKFVDDTSCNTALVNTAAFGDVSREVEKIEWPSMEILRLHFRASEDKVILDI